MSKEFYGALSWAGGGTSVAFVFSGHPFIGLGIMVAYTIYNTFFVE